MASSLSFAVGFMANEWCIFNLGTNNWQGGGEFAPGSGILHEGHHRSLNALTGVRCWSMWPSRTQRTDAAHSDYRVFPLEHDIPICESISPVSSYRWHKMTNKEFDAYRERLANEVEAFITHVETSEGVTFNLFFAHHTFVNPTVMVEVNRRRAAAGKARVPLVVFAHGTALKMYEHELKGTPDFPKRFITWMRDDQKVFDAQAGHVAGVYAIAEAQRDLFTKIFPEFDAKRVIVTPNGYNQLVFKPCPDAKPFDALPPVFSPELPLAALPEGVRRGLGIDDAGVAPSRIPAARYDKYVMFTGKFADWKRLDVVLKAAAIYTAKLNGQYRVATLIAGTGPAEDQLYYNRLAYEKLQLGATWFLGPQPQPMLAQLNTVADVGVFPSKDEPFGLVFIECMACGTPVIGARSGGPKDFVTPEVGTLVWESDDHEVLADRVATAVQCAIREDWKAKRGAACVEYVMKNFSLQSQCDKMLAAVSQHFGSAESRQGRTSSRPAADEQPPRSQPKPKM